MSTLMITARTALFALALAQAPALALAQPAQVPVMPPGGFPEGKPDAKLAPGGTYALDPDHAAVIARVSHLGYSFSLFRFDRIEGTLQWDPAAPQSANLSVTVAPGSVATNVKDFAPEIAGDKFLNAGTFPKATFVSTAFRQTDATHGKVDGQFTLMGKTRPVTFDATLIGAGAGFGKPRIGVHATTTIDPQAYGLPAMFEAPIQLVVDTEFERTR